MQRDEVLRVEREGLEIVPGSSSRDSSPPLTVPGQDTPALPQRDVTELHLVEVLEEVSEGHPPLPVTVEVEPHPGPLALPQHLPLPRPVTPPPPPLYGVTLHTEQD